MHIHVQLEAIIIQETKIFFKNDEDVGMKKAQKQDIIQNGRLEFYTHSYIPQAMIYNVTIILCGM